jgi:hypothetical protein
MKGTKAKINPMCNSVVYYIMKPILYREAINIHFSETKILFNLMEMVNASLLLKK